MTTPPLAALTLALNALRQGQSTATEFARLARGQSTLLQQLPERFEVVLFDLLDRLESSALFTEESCSFSQGDLLDSLQLWLDKAALRLQTPPRP
jgi:hypothetical protein